VVSPAFLTPVKLTIEKDPKTPWRSNDWHHKFMSKRHKKKSCREENARCWILFRGCCL